METNLKCLIVDDDLLARKSLERLCAKLEVIELVDTCASAEEALVCLRKNEVDLLLLDIEMEGLSGLEMLEQLSVTPQVIFTTSKEEYAYEAFAYDVTDYLKKPFDFPRFRRAIDKAYHLFQQSQAYKRQARDVYLRVEGRLVRVAFDDILYFENVGDYIKVFTRQGHYLIHGTLKTLAQKLPHPRFFRVHRSFIINLDKIKDIEEGTLVIDKAVIPISRANRPALLRQLNLL